MLASTLFPRVRTAATRLPPAARSAQLLVVAVAAWSALAGNLALWRSLWRLDGSWAATGAPALALAVMLFAATAGLLAFGAWGAAVRWVALAWLLVAGVAQHFMLAYGSVMDAGMLASAFQTDWHEARDLLGLPLLLHGLLLVAPAAWWLWRAPVAVQAPRTAALRNAGLLAAALLALVAAAFAGYRSLAPLLRNHTELRYQLNPVAALWSAASPHLKALRRRDAAGPLIPVAVGTTLGGSHALAAGGRPPLLLLFVGETARSDHFATNGYARDTTPEIAAAGAISWPSVRSCGTNTLHSVPCMFSPWGKAGWEARKRDSENLMDVLQAAGFAVLWVDNQSGCKGVCDRVPSASTADRAQTEAGRALCGADGECLDAMLLEGLDARIAALPAERRARGVVVALHMMGSHGPAYHRRADAAHKRFLPECTTHQLADCDRAELVNAYDNSIAYTDHVLGSAIGWLRARDAQWAGSMLYLSDHGESLGEYGLFLHGVPYAVAPEVQKHVPMVGWFGDGFTRWRGLDRACVAEGRSQPLTHDNLYHGVLGLLDVGNPTYRPALDAWRGCAPSRQRPSALPA